MPKEDAEIESGRLDGRVILQAPVYNTDGDEITGWSDVITVWAAVEPAGGSQLALANQDISQLPVMVTIRFRSDVDARWRVVDGSHTYEVQAVADVARRRATLALHCTEVV